MKTVERDEEKQVPPFGRNDKDVSPTGRNDKVISQTERSGKAISLPERDESWARICATVGGALWAGIAVLARMGVARIGAIELLFLFAPLVIVPLGMVLGREIGGTRRIDALAQWLQPIAAALAVVALCLPPGRNAGLLSLGWLLVCLILAGSGVRDLFRATWGDARGIARVIFAVGRMDLAVGGAWLVASRLGMRPMGIQEPIGLLTAVHFHFAGFATATIASATLLGSARRGESRWLKSIVLLVAAMPVVVAVGFVVSPALKMAAAILFSASVGVLAIAVHNCGRKAVDPTARILLQAAAICIFAGMVLSGTYAIVDFMGSEVLTIPQMARTHGLLNAIGFCLAGILGWILESRRAFQGGGSI